MGSDVEELLYALVAVDRRAAVWCAAQCARTVLHLVPEGDLRPAEAIEAAEAWVRGELDEQEVCGIAAERAAGAEREAHQLARTATRAALRSDAADATAATYAARAAKRAAASVCSAHPASAAEAAAQAVAFSASVDARSDLDAEWRRAYHTHLETLRRLVGAERWPWTQPLADRTQPLADRPQPTARLDPLDDPRTTGITIPDLLVARARARRLGLDWSDPRQRARAERTTDSSEPSPAQDQPRSRSTQ